MHSAWIIFISIPVTKCNFEFFFCRKGFEKAKFSRIPKSHSKALDSFFGA